MAALILEALVLRGVAVLRDESVVGLRLGASVVAGPHAPGVGNSMRYPRPGNQRPERGWADTDDATGTSGIMPGAGRSRCLAGLVGATGQTAGRGTHRWCQAHGGEAPAAVTKPSAHAACFVASVSAGFSSGASRLPATRTLLAAARVKV